MIFLYHFSIFSQFFAVPHCCVKFQQSSFMPQTLNSMHMAAFFMAAGSWLARWFGYQRWSQMSSLYFCEKPRKWWYYGSCKLFLLVSRVSVYCPQPSVLENRIMYTMQKSTHRSKCKEKNIWTSASVCCTHIFQIIMWSIYTLGICDFKLVKQHFFNKQCCGSVCFWASWIRIRIH